MNLKKLLLTVGLFTSMASVQASFADLMQNTTEDLAAEAADKAAELAQKTAAIAAAQAAKLTRAATEEIAQIVRQQATIFAQNEIAQIALEKTAQAAKEQMSDVATETLQDASISSYIYYACGKAWIGLKTMFGWSAVLTEKTGEFMSKHPKVSTAILLTSAYAVYEYKETLKLRAAGMRSLAANGYFNYNNVRLTTIHDIENLVWRVEIPAIPLSPIAIWKSTLGKLINH